jgi:predicted metal-binding protein
VDRRGHVVKAGWSNACFPGCPDWGKGYTCPSRPGSTTMFEYAEILRRHAYGILVHAHDKKTKQEVSYEIEQRA